jgi:hypothetical protein
MRYSFRKKMMKKEEEKYLRVSDMRLKIMEIKRFYIF